MSFAINELTPHIFQLTEYEKSKSDSSDHKKIKRTTYVKHELIPVGGESTKGESSKESNPLAIFDWVMKQERISLTGTSQEQRLKIKTSPDQKTWTDLKFDYRAFERNVIEKVEEILSEKKSGATIPLKWLVDINMINITKFVIGQHTMVMLSGCRGLKEDWKKQTWMVFDKIADRFWNSHNVIISCTMKPSEQAARLVIDHNDNPEERAEHVKNHQQNYQTLRRNARLALEIMNPGEERALDYPTEMYWNPINDYFVHREIADELRKQGADLVRINGRMCVKKDS